MFRFKCAKPSQTFASARRARHFRTWYTFTDVQTYGQFGRRTSEHGGMCRVVANVRHLVCNDQMMLGVDGGLHIVPDDSGPAATRRHRAAIGICQRNLLIG